MVMDPLKLTNWYGELIEELNHLCTSSKTTKLNTPTCSYSSTSPKRSHNLPLHSHKALSVWWKILSFPTSEWAIGDTDDGHDNEPLSISPEVILSLSLWSHGWSGGWLFFFSCWDVQMHFAGNRKFITIIWDLWCVSYIEWLSELCE